MKKRNIQQENILRITARYVEEVQAGRKPRLSDYLKRYPEHSEAIASFVAYYHGLEEDIAEDQAVFPVLPALSETSRLALEQAQKRLISSVSEHETRAMVAEQIEAYQAQQTQSFRQGMGKSKELTGPKEE